MTTDTENRIVSLKFQSAAIVINCLILLYLIHGSLTRFKSSDVAPKIHYITPKNINDFGENYSTVQVGLCVKDFLLFDIVKNKFIMDAIVWFKFDPSQVPLDIIEKFTFEKCDSISKSSPDIKITENNNIFVQYDVKVHFSSNMQYSLFPIDSHTIYLILINNLASPAEFVFQSEVSDFIIVPDMRRYGWQEVNHRVKTGYSALDLKEYSKKDIINRPVTVFEIDYLRSSIRYILSIFLPLLIIFFVTIFTFSLNPVEFAKTIYTIATAGITALIAYSFVIENLSPAVGYFMLSNYMFFLFFFATFIIFVLNVFTLNLSSLQKKIIIVILHSSVIISCIYLFRI